MVCRSNMLYLVPGVDPLLMRDSSMLIAMTEGEFKTPGRLWRLANTAPQIGPGFCPSAFQAFTTGEARSAKRSGQIAVA